MPNVPQLYSPKIKHMFTLVILVMVADMGRGYMARK